MASNRISRINEDIQRELAELLRSVKDPRVQGMLSITRAECSGDLRYAKIYISSLEQRDEKQLLQGLKSAAGWLRHELGSRLQLRTVPELQFHLDNSIAQGARISSILNKLDLPPVEETEGEEEES